MSSPTVSIIVPTYNRAALLRRALDSVVAQTFEDWEIVLIDDGSTDGTSDLAADYAAWLGSRLVCLRQANAGCCAARNRGIEAASGRFIAFLDSDDEFLPHKLERQLALFEQAPQLGFVYSDSAYVDLEGRHHESTFDSVAPLARQVDFEKIGPGLCVCADRTFDVLLRGYFISTIVGMVRREVLGEKIRFCLDPAYAEEWLFHLRVTQACASGFVDEPLSLHHYVAESNARTDRRRNTVLLRKLLIEMLEVLAPLTLRQRNVVRRNLARCCRQLGYDASRDGDYSGAMRCFWESFRHKKRLGAARDAIQAGVRALLPGGGRTAVPKSV